MLPSPFALHHVRSTYLLLAASKRELLRTRSRRSEYVVNTTTDLTSQGFDLVHWNCIEASERLLHQYACAQSFACKLLADRAPRSLAGDAVALRARHTARLESFTSGYHPSLPTSMGDTNFPRLNPGSSSSSSSFFFFSAWTPLRRVLRVNFSRLCVSSP